MGLIGLHNLEESHLFKIYRSGGMPLPSIAIIPADSLYTSFGAISLLANPSLYDPEVSRDVHVYPHDIYSPMVPSGADVENSSASQLLRLMRTNSIAGGENGSYSTAFRARVKSARRLKTLDECLNHAGSILSTEEFATQRAEIEIAFGRAISQAVSSMEVPANVDQSFFNAMFRRAGGILEEILALEAFGLHDVKAAVAQAGFPVEVSPQFLDIAVSLSRAGTEYLEAKIDRVVNLSEFQCAILPHDTKHDVLEILIRMGLPDHRFYDRTDEADRLEVTRQASLELACVLGIDTHNPNVGPQPIML